MDRSTLLILSFNGITTGIWSASATTREPTNWNLEPIASGSGKLNPKKISSGKGGRKYSLHPPRRDRGFAIASQSYTEELGSDRVSVHALACTIGSVLWFRCYFTLTFSRSMRFVVENHHQVVLNLSSTSCFSTRRRSSRTVCEPLICLYIESARCRE